MSDTGIIHYPRRGAGWGSQPWWCGADTGSAINILAMINCPDCLKLMGRGVEDHPPVHTPPYMNDNEDGLFIFHDRHHGPEYTMELAPQSTGNIEITLEGPNGDGHIFTLSHLDRADMIRALLHDFHYSPERGGPNDGIDS